MHSALLIKLPQRTQLSISHEDHPETSEGLKSVCVCILILSAIQETRHFVGPTEPYKIWAFVTLKIPFSIALHGNKDVLHFSC